MPTLLSHGLPFVLFLVPRFVAEYLPESTQPWTYGAGTVAALVALLVFWKRGCYGELTRQEPAAGGATVLAIVAGVVVGLVWAPLSIPELTLSMGAREGFDADAAGASLAPVLLGLRLLGSVAIVPFAEELLVRSLIPRMVDAGAREDGDWTKVPVGSFTWKSALASIGFFVLAHPEWAAALVTGVIWTLLLRRTRRLGDLVLSHAIANAAVAVWVLGFDRTQLW